MSQMFFPVPIYSGHSQPLPFKSTKYRSLSWHLSRSSSGQQRTLVAVHVSRGKVSSIDELMGSQPWNGTSNAQQDTKKLTNQVSGPFGLAYVISAIFQMKTRSLRACVSENSTKLFGQVTHLSNRALDEVFVSGQLEHVNTENVTEPIKFSNKSEKLTTICGRYSGQLVN